MTTTILAAIALSGALVPAAKPEFRPQTDYASALKQAASEGKPMVVLIGTGNPFAKMMGDARMTDETTQLLRDKFVCVSVDVSTTKGAELAGQFQLTDGLVISSTGGTYQALRQPGTVTASDLAKHASTYANAPSTPSTTVTAGAPVISTAVPATSAPYTVYPAGYSAPVYRGTVIQGGCPGGNCPNVIQGGYVFPSGSSCPNGRCPTPR
ncbi:MAG TPA: hypothetical protein VGE74_01145 [Gemmata sp.]